MTSKIYLTVCIALALLLMHLYNVSTSFRQSTVWTGPYLSAAANLSWPLSFKIDVEEIKHFNVLDDTKTEDQYQFHPSAKLVPYTYNDLGYVYLIWLAKKLFFFLGDQHAIMFLQALVHLILCMLLTDRAVPKVWRVGYFLLYTINPLVLRYVVFNHYYFWQSIPSLLVVFLSLRGTKPTFLYLALFLLPWTSLARTTTILVLPVILFLLYRYYNPRLMLAAIGYFALVWMFFYKPTQKNIWHTAYIGTGAYHNPYGIALNDNDGFELYTKTFGSKLSASTGGNVYEPKIYAQYKTLTKNTFLTQFYDVPALYLKNAFVNFLGAYSLGYLAGKPDWMNYLLSLSGLGVILLFIRYRQWEFLMSIGLLSFAFTPYYPPVPAYMYANYALIAGGIATCFMKFRANERKEILYLSFNDGSDMRINKELRTLSQLASVTLMAIGTDNSQCYATPFAHTLHFVNGSRKSVATLIRYFSRSAYLLLTKSYHSVHIINEPQLIVLWPFLWVQKNVVLDIFDSLFLRRNLPKNRAYWLKKLVYAPVNRAIVTDENRLELLPDFLQEKSVVVPNYPYELQVLPQKERSTNLTLMYYGWLGELRGTETVRHLLAADPGLHVIMAGWLADEPSHALTRHPRVEWLGVLPQAEAMHIAAVKADYIMCVYAPSNDNNINASPNKIFDAIQTQTPVIINAEVKVSEFVKANQMGYILNQYSPSDYASLARTLYLQRESYEFSASLRKKYSWENAELALLTAHRL